MSPSSPRIELAQPWDFNFIIDSWCNDELVNVSRQSGEDEEVFKVGQRTRIFRLLQNHQCAVVRPEGASDSRKLAGWICYSLDRATLRPIVHFVYVKAEFRNKGVADLLLTAAGVKPEHGAWSTHNRLRLKKATRARGIVFNRFLLDYDPAAKTPRQDPYRP